MILIADSGSTKCSWALCDEKGDIILECNTIGFNPYFIDSSNILKHLRKSILEEHKNKIDTVFFYGAGCSSEDKNKIIKETFTVFFDNALIIIRNDIEAACYAMCNNIPNITCILGTGSNSCYFDGKHIVENAPSLGFLVGDEASGNYFGKKILKLYFNKALSNDLILKLESSYETNLSVIMENIYNNDRANVYLSKYFPFVSKNKDHPIMRDVIYKGLNEFFDLHVVCYKNYKDTEINFSGSVAYYLSNEIYAVAKKHGCKVGNIIQNPIKKLIDFHFNHKLTGN